MRTGYKHEIMKDQKSFDSICKWVSRYWEDSHIPLPIITEALQDIKTHQSAFAFGIQAPICYPQHVSESQAAQKILKQSGRRVIVQLCSSSIPLNNAAFPRGFLVGGTKFPLQSDSRVKETVALAPATKLKFPRYRVLALKSGIDRRFFKSTLSQLVEETNRLLFPSFTHQTTYLSYKLWSSYFESAPLPLLSVPIENLAQYLLKSDQADFDFYKSQHFTENFWEVRQDFKRGELRREGDRITGAELECELSEASIQDLIQTERVFPKIQMSKRILEQAGLKALNLATSDNIFEVRDALALQNKFLLAEC
jgi:hypothetical protein